MRKFTNLAFQGELAFSPPATGIRRCLIFAFGNVLLSNFYRLLIEAGSSLCSGVFHAPGSHLANFALLPESAKGENAPTMASFKYASCHRREFPLTEKGCLIW